MRKFTYGSTSQTDPIYRGHSSSLDDVNWLGILTNVPPRQRSAGGREDNIILAGYNTRKAVSWFIGLAWVVQNLSAMAPLEKDPQANRVPGLHALFLQGEGLFSQNRFDQAEICFRKILKADSNDWDAHEMLLRIYRKTGVSEGVRRESSALRRLAHAGLGWRPYFCWDQFLHNGNWVQAQELVKLEFPGFRVLRFLIHDGTDVRFLFAIRMTIKEKPTKGRSEAFPAAGGPKNEITLQWLG